MSVCGRYVKRFEQASHAMPDGMHMNADYPLMLPPVVRVVDGVVHLRGRDAREYAGKVRHDRRGEYVEIAQSSSFETIYRRPPKTFKFYPFKDEDTAAIGGETGGLFGAEHD